MLKDLYEWLAQPGAIPRVFAAGVGLGALIGWSLGRLSVLRGAQTLHVSEKRLEQLHREAGSSRGGQ